MNLDRCYSLFNGDLNGTISRLGSSSLLEKLIKKYLDDKSMDSLNTAIENKDCQEAFKAAHTMKGTALNLGFSDLAKSSSELTEILREGRLSDSFDAYLQVKNDYAKVINAIKSEIDA